MIGLKELGIAYRKAKADLFYSSHPSLEAIAGYEEDLHSNLVKLRDRINGDDDSWVTSPDFLGSWTLATKSVTRADWKRGAESCGNGFVFSSPTDEWEYSCEALSKLGKPKPEAEFRVMAQCSLDFHVLSTLWLLKVGHLYDAQLSACAYGNRLRRTQNGKSINELSLGSFHPYFWPFREWRDNGINAMRVALDENKKIVALTADVSSFYHELNPGFMLNQSFVEDIMSLDLNADQTKLNRRFINALEAWAAVTPLKKGLPVGLPASAVVANAALIELDRIIEKQIVPLYYGRYVDDILLVMENRPGFSSTVEVWEWIFDRSDGKLSWGRGPEKDQICFRPDYLTKGKNKSQIRFENDKNKVFILGGEPGKTLVNAIARQILERASEWRAMPRLPRNASLVGTDLLAATQSDGEAADNLRKTDALTMRRAGFAIKLRDFEAYERDLHPDAWRDHRRAFFRAFVEHVLVLPKFFDLAIYLPRVIRLATACEDFAELKEVVESIDRLSRQVGEQCDISIKAQPETGPGMSSADIMNCWTDQLFSSVLESIIAAFPPRLTKEGRQAWQEHMAGWSMAAEGGPGQSASVKELQKQQARLFSFDLAHIPFRFIGLPAELVTRRGIPAKRTVSSCIDAPNILPDSVLVGARQLAKWAKLKGMPHGLLFATRPVNLPELFILNKDAYSAAEHGAMQTVVLAMRGFKLNDKTPVFDKKGVLQIPDSVVLRKYGIAVASWKSRLGSWAAAVTCARDPDASRYARLCRLLDGVIAQPRESRYLILPELALPAHWFIRIARKLQNRGISLISGIEYLHARRARVRNQVWAALSHDGLGFPALMIYRQDKQRPALHEEQELQRLGGRRMKPDVPWKGGFPPIIQHGELRFAVLVCSELTNINYRAHLRGKIDALFVPEWNPDTGTFTSLVESAALDIHAYIIQCNDRQYGDSRIRAPYKNRWQRDLLRVKGGVTDYCVVGEIDVLALRQFQSSHRSPAHPFKPVPDGFAIDPARKVLPEVETE